MLSTRSLANSAILLLLSCLPLFPQATPTGTVTGTVFDSGTGSPIAQAAVSASGPVNLSTVTNTDGKFTLALPPGQYTLTYQAPKYLAAKTENVAVREDANTDASTVLAAASAVTSVDVNASVAPALATAESVLEERKLSAAVTDGLSSEEIRKSVASDAAGVVSQVTGVSIVESGYVFVRGLGERYSSTMLNGSVIPTTETEKRVVPLDLFPAALLDNINIVKSYTPNLPGDFSAGVVQMKTVDFPKQKVLRFTMRMGGNTRTTGQEMLTYKGGPWDFFGFNSGVRSLPADVPVGARVIPGKYSPTQLQEIGRSFTDNWQPVDVGTWVRPAQSYSMVAGNTFGRFGLIGALTFQNRPQVQNELQRYLRQSGEGPYIFTDYPEFRNDIENSRWGGVFNVAVKLTDNNKLLFRNTLTHDTDKESRIFEGYDGTNDGILQSQRLRWVERGVMATGVEGQHSLPKLWNTLVNWQFNYARTNRYDPDMREVIRGKLADDRYIFLGLSSSGQRFFNRMEEEMYEPMVDISKPFYKGGITGMLSMGFRGTFRERFFQARRFRFIPQNSSTLPLFAPSDVLFLPQNIRPNGMQLTEFTRATDTYTANMEVYAGYAMADISFGPRWRVSGGLRVEAADQEVITLDPLVPGAIPEISQLANTDPLPAVTVIYAMTPKQNLRASYARTVNRPEFRELSPFDFNNVYGGFVTQGNKNLVRATVDNVDGRWEWFLGGNQLVAASVFYKNFTNPIEVTILPSNDLRQTYVNALGARNVGFELEGRTGLGRFFKPMREFSLQGNFTFVDSQIRIRPADATLLTSKDRPMLGQSRYIYNAIVDWNRARWRSQAQFDVNYVGRRISDVGTFGIPDIYQQGNTFMNVSYTYTFDERGRYQMRLTGENLADNNYLWTQGEYVQRSFRLGRTFTIGLSISVF